VRGAVVLADVGLDLDDPAAPAALTGLVDELGAEDPAGDLERRSGEERGGVRQERDVKSDCRSTGISSPKMFMKPGMSRERNSSDVFELS
jgi:hypothetical protein